MKQIENKVFEMVSKVALRTAKKQANSACMFLGYQPKAPDKINVLKKEELKKSEK